MKDSTDHSVLDEIPPESYLDQYGIQILPFAVAAEVVIFRLNSSLISFNFRLSRETLVKIYLGMRLFFVNISGEIQFWDDPMILETNPFDTLPHQKIIPLHRHTSLFLIIHRTDLVGTAASDIFLASMCSFNSTIWTKCSTEDFSVWPIPNPSPFTTLNSAEEMLLAVTETVFSIGYVKVSIAEFTTGGGVVSLQNKAGEYIFGSIAKLQVLNIFNIDFY